MIERRWTLSGLALLVLVAAVPCTAQTSPPSQVRAAYAAGGVAFVAKVATIVADPGTPPTTSVLKVTVTDPLAQSGLQHGAVLAFRYWSAASTPEMLQADFRVDEETLFLVATAPLDGQVNDFVSGAQAHDRAFRLGIHPSGEIESETVTAVDVHSTKTETVRSRDLYFWDAARARSPLRTP